MTLLGAENVERAGRNIDGAAETMSRAANTIDGALERHAQRLGEHVGRTEHALQQAAQERPTLRDYFAAHVSIGHGDDTDLTLSVAKQVMGSDPPTPGNLEWWQEAEARLRYAKADAMLKARSK